MKIHVSGWSERGFIQNDAGGNEVAQADLAYYTVGSA